MKPELKEIRINETDVLLQDNLVRGSILPQRISELNRNIIFKGNNVVEGPIYGHRIEIQQGELEVQGAVFAQLELYVNSEAKGVVEFKKCVGSANSIVSRAANCRIIFDSDINAKSVSLMLYSKRSASKKGASSRDSRSESTLSPRSWCFASAGSNLKDIPLCFHTIESKRLPR